MLIILTWKSLLNGLSKHYSSYVLCWYSILLNSSFSSLRSVLISRINLVPQLILDYEHTIIITFSCMNVFLWHKCPYYKSISKHSLISILGLTPISNQLIEAEHTRLHSQTTVAATSAHSGASKLCHKPSQRRRMQTSSQHFTQQKTASQFMHLVALHAQ